MSRLSGEAPLQRGGTSLVFQLQLGNCGLEPLVGSKRALWLIEREVPASGPCLVHPHANGDLKSSQFGPQNTVPIGWNGASLIV